jgi:hypothetical protein
VYIFLLTLQLRTGEVAGFWPGPRWFCNRSFNVAPSPVSTPGTKWVRPSSTSLPLSPSSSDMTFQEFLANGHGFASWFDSCSRIRAPTIDRTRWLIGADRVRSIVEKARNRTIVQKGFFRFKHKVNGWSLSSPWSEYEETARIRVCQRKISRTWPQIKPYP